MRKPIEVDVYGVELTLALEMISLYLKDFGYMLDEIQDVLAIYKDDITDFYLPRPGRGHPRLLT